MAEAIDVVGATASSVMMMTSPPGLPSASPSAAGMVMDALQGNINGNDDADGSAAALLKPPPPVNRGVVTPEILAAQISFVCPAGFRMFRVPHPTESRSLMYNFGVRVEEVVDDHIVSSQNPHQPQMVGSTAMSYGKKLRVAGRFYCMADVRCRDRQTFVRISNKCTTSASDHLRVVHGITSERSVVRTQLLRDKKAGNGGSIVRATAQPKTPKREMRRSFKAENLRASERYVSDRDRFVALDYVKSHTILGLEPLDYLENGHRKTHLLLVSGKKQLFPVDMLDSRGIARGLVEIYDARTTAVKRALAREVQTTPIRFVHISVDRWEAGVSSRDGEYVGLRAHYMTNDFRLKSHLLAVRRCDPANGVFSEKAAELVTLWVGQVLEEYGLDWSAVAGAVADAGADEDLAFLGGIPGVLREVCIPTALDRAMSEAFGMEAEAGAVRNKAAHDVVTGVGRVMDRVDEAEGAQHGLEGLREDESRRPPKVGQLRQAVADRWERGVETLERFLAYYPALESFFAAKEGGQMGFAFKPELQEIYTLIKSLAGVIPTCQSTAEPSSPAAMLRLIMLLSADLDTTKPLELQDTGHCLPPPVAADTGRLDGQAPPPGSPAAATVAAALLTPKKAPRISKQPGELTDVGRTTRAMARSLVYQRFGLRRWGRDFDQESHLFDMVLALHPGCRQLGYMDRLSPEAPAVVSAIKAKVYAQIMRLVEVVIESERAATARALPGGPAGAGGYASRSTPRKRPKVAVASPFDDEPGGEEDEEEDEEEDDPMASAGVFDAVASGRGEDDERMSAADEASEVTKAWCAAKLPAHYRTIRTGEGLAEFWRTYGSKNFRLLSVVARSVIAAPGSAAVLERDVDDSGGLANNRQRGGGSSLDQGYREMAMLLCAAFESVPEDIPRLSEDAVEEAIPRRFRDPQMQEELAGLARDDGCAEGGCGVALFGLKTGGALEGGLRERAGEGAGEGSWVRSTWHR